MVLKWVFDVIICNFFNHNRIKTLQIFYETKKNNYSQSRLFETRLTDLLNPKHQVLKLSKLIDWDSLEKQCSAIFIDNGLGGHPSK